MNLLIRWHMAMAMFHITWLSFWLHWEPEPPDTTAKMTKYPPLVQWTVTDAGETANSTDRWLRQQVRR